MQSYPDGQELTADEWSIPRLLRGECFAGTIFFIEYMDQNLERIIKFFASLIYNAQVKVILVSGYTKEEIKTRFIDKKTVGYLRKPYTLAQLSAVPSQVLAESRVLSIHLSCILG